jgi:hypothetical protein
MLYLSDLCLIIFLSSLSHAKLAYVYTSVFGFWSVIWIYFGYLCAYFMLFKLISLCYYINYVTMNIFYN